MNFDIIREYVLNKKHVTESQPFGDDVLVYKVVDKMFMSMNFEIPPEINLKCDPETAIELRERYESVLPGYHMNKTHWNTVIINDTIPPKEIFKMIDDSYNLIVNGFSVSKRKQYFDS